MEFNKETKESVLNILHKYLFWFLISCLVGIIIGVKSSQIYFKHKVEESIKIGGMVFNSKVYQITEK